MMKRLTLKRSSNNKSTYEEPPLPAKQQQQSRRSHSYNNFDYAEVVSERQILPPDVLHELRRACALILRETGPSEEDYAAILSQPDPLDLFQKEQQEIRNVREAASASQTSLPSLFHSSTTKKRDSKHLREDFSAANRSTNHDAHHDRSSKSHKYAHSKELSRKPVPAVMQYEETSRSQRSEERPLAPVTTSQSGPKQPRKSAPTSHHLDSARTQMSGRQKTKSDPILDYAALPAERRQRESRRIRPGVEELRVPSHNAEAPAHMEGHRAEGGHHRRIESHNERHQADYEAKRRSRHEMMEAAAERDKRISAVNPDYIHVPTLNPTDYRPPQPYQPVREQQRPQSRAGNIIGNIRDGIRDYVMPRPSLASTRLQSRSASRTASRAESRMESRSASRSSSRPPSRGSFSQTGRSWLKGAANGLRRKSSWSSFRSNAEDDDDLENGKSKGPDLNRSLPPLPGLDQYKEPKVHIAHLLARGPAPPPIDTNMSVTSLPNGSTASPHRQNGSDFGPTPPAKYDSNSALGKPRSPLTAQSASSIPQAWNTSQPASASGPSTGSAFPTSAAPQSASAQKSSASVPQVTREPHPGSEQTSKTAFPPRTTSISAPKLRMPFANENDSAAASRVVSSIEPGFIDLELKRRLQGKISSPVSPVDPGSTSQLFLNAQGLPPPPPKHEHPAFSKSRGPVPTAEPESSTATPRETTKLSDTAEQAAPSSASADDRQNSFLSQSSIEARSGALGVDRRPQLPSGHSNSFTRAPEQQRRADSALGSSGDLPHGNHRASREREREGGRTGSRGTVETFQSSVTTGTAPGALGGNAETSSNATAESTTVDGAHHIVSASMYEKPAPPPPRPTARDLASSPIPTSRAAEEMEWRGMREIVGGGALVGLEDDEASKRRRARMLERERQLSGGGSDRSRGGGGNGGRRFDDRDRERARAIAIMGAQEPSKGSRPGTWRRRTGSDPALAEFNKPPPKKGLRNRLSRLLSGAGQDPGQGKMALSVN